MMLTPETVRIEIRKVIFRGAIVPRRGWLQSSQAMLYWRRYDMAGRRYFDVANIAVEEECQGQGVFSDMIEWIEKASDETGTTVVVENIFVPRLAAFLIRRGYVGVAALSHEGVMTLQRLPQVRMGK